MDRQTKNELDFIIQIIILVLVTAVALIGPIISFIHQYHLIVEEFGKFIGGIFIYDNYAWWNLTVLIWIPYGIYLVAWHKKANKEMAKDMYKLMYWEKESKMIKTNTPEIGKTYAFFDDGKTGFYRRYKATVTGIIPFHLIKAKYPELYYSWQRETRCTPDLYANSTDYFVECLIPKYDDGFVYFVRDTKNGWFSIDYPHGWMSGLLDVDGEYGRKNDVPPVDEWVAGKDYLGD